MPAVLREPRGHQHLGQVWASILGGELSLLLAKALKLEIEQVLQEWPKGLHWCFIAAQSDLGLQKAWPSLHLRLAVPPKHSFTHTLP